MKFVTVAQIFEGIEKESSRTKITEILAHLLQQATAQEAQIISYLSLGSLFPPYKTLQINVAKKGMLTVVADVSNHTLSYIQQQFKQLGDLGLVMQQEWQGNIIDISLLDMYDRLVECAQFSGIGSTEKRHKYLVDLLRSVDELSAKYIVRIVTGTLRLGFSDMTLIDALSWMQIGDKSIRKQLEHAYNICADLGLVAYTLKDKGIQGIEGMQIQVGIPIRPAAAERAASAQEIIDRLGSCVAQLKLDGFRLQVHMQKKEDKAQVHFFSRNLLDMSEMFPDLVQVIQRLNVESLIFEGEAIVYDELTETFLPFQETVKRKRKHGVQQASESLPLRLYIFDILYLNGTSMLDKTHRERRKILKDLLSMCHDERVQAIEERPVATKEELKTYFLNSIHGGLEGLVVKREDAIYQPGKRNFNWIKLKRHARGKLTDTVDVVVLGYYYGQGKRVDFGVGSFLVGVYNQQLDIFQSVAKIGTGMKDHEWKDLKFKCDQLQVKEKPAQVQVSKDLYPDVWTLPSIVCTVQCEEITKSPVHTAGKIDNDYGLALRFPRFITYRLDKSAQDATTVVELQSLYQQQK